MKRSELERLLRDNGCYPLNKGTRHDKWYSPISGLVVLLPRHQAKEMAIGTVREILKTAGLL